MVFQSNSYLSPEEVALIKMQDADHKGDAESTLFELVIELQLSHSKTLAGIRKLVAPLGDGYFYFRNSGDLCFVTDFTKIAN